MLLDSGSALQLGFVEGFQPAAGESLFFSYAQVPHRRFGSLNLPTLCCGLVWDESSFYTGGELRVAAVPDLPTYAASIAGLLVMGAALRRRRGCNG